MLCTHERKGYASKAPAFGVNMPSSEKHSVARYNAGCRCDQCKQAASEYHKARRRRLSEAVGDPGPSSGAALRVLRGGENNPLTSTNADLDQQIPANSRVAAVAEEIELIGGHKRPALAAAALALAEILDNPKATSTKPAAARGLADLLEQLRKGADGKRSKLASVRAMTSTNAAAG